MPKHCTEVNHIIQQEFKTLESYHSNYHVILSYLLWVKEKTYPVHITKESTRNVAFFWTTHCIAGGRLWQKLGQVQESCIFFFLPEFPTFGPHLCQRSVLIVIVRLSLWCKLTADPMPNTKSWGIEHCTQIGKHSLGRAVQSYCSI